MKTPSSTKVKKPQRKKPTATVVREIYARAAGRCLLCQKPLLDTKDLGAYSFNMGEMAHIVGQSLDIASSPRSEFDLPKELRDEADNFLLLCPVCHDNIDAAVTRKDFTVEWLRGWKKDQEAHIEHVTGLPQSHRTCIVRLTGLIRGNMVHITPAECNSATLHHNTPRFAFFPLVYGRQEVEIDLVPLGEPEQNLNYWEEGQRAIQRQLGAIRGGIEQGEIDHLSVFGFARIPLLIHFGFALGNKVGTSLFQRRRVDTNHWHWKQEIPTQAFEWTCLQQGMDARCVALVLNVSGSIQREELPVAIDERYFVFMIHPTGIDPQPDAVLSEASLESFRNCYRQWLAYLETKHKTARVVHVFPAIPAAVAISVGMDLMPHVQPELLIYDRVPRDFSPTLSINASR